MHDCVIEKEITIMMGLHKPAILDSVYVYVHTKGFCYDYAHTFHFSP